MIKLKTALSKNRRSLIRAAVMLFIFVVICIFMSNNYFLYSSSVIKITSAERISSYDKVGTNGNTEKYYKQQLVGTVKNGEFKGKTVRFTNEFSFSSVATSEYKAGNEVFADIHESNGNPEININGVKRDIYIFLLMAIFTFVVLIASGKRGFLTIISVFINVIVFTVSIKVFGTGNFINYIWIILLLIFTVMTLFLAVGFNKKAVGSIISTLCTIAVIAALYIFTVYRNYDLPYDTMEYIVAFLPLKKIYLISIIIGCLGAVMDVSITVNSSVFELIAVSKNNIDMKSLIISVREIGRDIMGTMVNVLFFSYISGSIPLIVLQLTNNIGFNLVIKYDYIFDIIRFLIGSIGIIAAIPISALIAILFFKKGLKSE